MSESQPVDARQDRLLTPPLAEGLVEQVQNAFQRNEPISGRDLPADFRELRRRVGEPINKPTAHEWADAFTRGRADGNLGKPHAPPSYASDDGRLIYDAAYQAGVAMRSQPDPPHVQEMIEQMNREVGRIGLKWGSLILAVGLVGLVGLALVAIAFRNGRVYPVAAIMVTGWTLFGLAMVGESSWKIWRMRRATARCRSEVADGEPT